MSDKVSCRYCPFYAPDILTPIKGYCAASLPPRLIMLPYSACPFDNDFPLIEDLAASRGFDEHILRQISFRLDSFFTTREYRTLEALRKDNPHALRAMAIYRDFNGRIFYRATISLEAPS